MRTSISSPFRRRSISATGPTSARCWRRRKMLARPGSTPAGGRRSFTRARSIPGVTEDLCGPLIEEVSGLERGRDFRLGYSPERINPGDREHTFDRITKVIAGEDEEVTEQLAAALWRDHQRGRVPGRLDQGGRGRQGDRECAARHQHRVRERNDPDLLEDRRFGVGRARRGADEVELPGRSSRGWSAATASASILITSAIGPQRVGHDPQVILAGRQTNDGMGAWIADTLHDRRRKAGRALVLGLTFKENVPDLATAAASIWSSGCNGWATRSRPPTRSRRRKRSNATMGSSSPSRMARVYDLVVGAVAHRAYRELPDDRIAALVAPGGTLADLKGMWRNTHLDPAIDRWTL